MPPPDVRGGGLCSRPPARPRSRWPGSGRSEPARRWEQASRARFDPRFGVDGLSGLFLGTLGLVAAAGARVLACAIWSRPRAGRAIAALTAGVPARHGGRRLRPRPAHVPPRLGADDAAAGRGDPRRARAATSTRGTRCSRTWRSRISAAPAPGSPCCCSPRRAPSAERPCVELGLGTADRDRARPRSSGWARRRA